MLKTMMTLTTLALLGVTMGALAPTAQAHVCAFEYGPSCSDAPCDVGTHSHWGNRFLPCWSVGTGLPRVCVNKVCVYVETRPGDLLP